MTCPNCGRELPSEGGASFCPYCGGRLEENKVTGWFRAALLGLLCMLLAGGMLFGVAALAHRCLELERMSSGEVSAVKVGLSEHEGCFYPGDTAKLAFEFYPNVKRTPKLSWSSSDESVAVIDETGRVKVLAEGEAELTVLLENGVTGSVTITANKKPERLELKESELTLKKGGVFVLEAKTFPEGSAYGSIEWKSKDPDILSVDEDGVIKGLAHGRTTVSAKLDCGLTAYADVLVYEFGFDILADLILRTGEVDYESECCFLALDHEQETDENGILVHKYTELIWYPDDEAISICCDIYDDDIERYYELSVDFYRDERYNAYIYFHCMLDAAGGAPMVPLVFSDGDETEAQAGFYLPNYVPGASAVFQWYNGEASFRDTAQEISDHMLEYALNKLKEKWGDLGLDITPAEALNLERL